LRLAGALRFTDADALAVFGELQRWLEETDVDVFGERLMTLRYQLFGELQDAGLIPRL
jgi:hypothetical protein